MAGSFYSVWERSYAAARPRTGNVQRLVNDERPGLGPPPFGSSAPRRILPREYSAVNVQSAPPSACKRCGRRATLAGSLAAPSSVASAHRGSPGPRSRRALRSPRRRAPPCALRRSTASSSVPSATLRASSRCISATSGSRLPPSTIACVSRPSCAWTAASSRRRLSAVTEEPVSSRCSSATAFSIVRAMTRGSSPLSIEKLLPLLGYTARTARARTPGAKATLAPFGHRLARPCSPVS